MEFEDFFIDFLSNKEVKVESVPFKALLSFLFSLSLQCLGKLS